MAVTELLRTESDGSLSFGNHTLNEKAKVDLSCGCRPMPQS